MSNKTNEEIKDDRSGKKYRRIAGGNKCVNCGKAVTDYEAPYYAMVTTRKFPVCSKECQEMTLAYVEKDKKYKTYLYLIMFFAAIGVFIGAIFSENPYIVYPCVALTGLAFLLFPYPIYSFDTFLKTPIKTVTLIFRIIGIILICLGIFFFVKLAL
jgi:predicted nucleic acid-binding Zn ribbon protein